MIKRFVLTLCLVFAMMSYGLPAHAVNDTDYTGIGSATWTDLTASDWYATPADVTCHSSYDGCAWSYNKFRLNCLDRALYPNSPAIQFLWVYPNTHTLSQTWIEQPGNKGAVRNQIRAAASLFSASVGGNLNLHNSSHKGQDRSPRIATTVVSGACQPNVVPVAVPLNVFMRAQIQSKSNGDGTKNGLFAWLETNGYNQPHIRYFSFMDATLLTSTQKNAVGWYSRAMAINMQAKQMMWGPYGSGQTSDVDTSPGAENICNSGGAVGYIAHGWSMYNGDFLPSWDENKDEAAYYIAHELGHTLCQNHLAPNYIVSDQHMDEYEDIMTNKNGFEDQCNSGGLQYRWELRFDCARNDYWGQNGVTSKTSQAWVSTRWDSSNNMFLWGAPKDSTPELFSVDAVGIDCTSLPKCFD